MKNKIRQKGQSMFELVVAIAMVALIAVAIVGVTALSIKATTFSRNKTLSAKYSLEATEWLRNQRDTSWEDFLVYANTANWCLSELNWDSPGSCLADSKISNTNLERSVSFVVNASEIQATVKIIWLDSGGTHETDSVTYFSNWKAD